MEMVMAMEMYTLLMFESERTSNKALNSSNDGGDDGDGYGSEDLLGN